MLVAVLVGMGKTIVKLPLFELQTILSLANESPIVGSVAFATFARKAWQFKFPVEWTSILYVSFKTGIEILQIRIRVAQESARETGGYTNRCFRSMI